MSNIEQGLRGLHKHRYSIKQLLALSGTAYNPFDLSRFTFDAARAGVIPFLGDCGMSSRRASATRPRDISSVSAVGLENVVAEVGGLPTRRPEPPPANVPAQHHTGFARFLKKHSSPTHRRVTAGGRIVPMEPRSAPPPPFLLPTSEPSQFEQGIGLGQQIQPEAARTSKSSMESAVNKPKPITNSQFASSQTTAQHASTFSERHQLFNDDMRPRGCNPMYPVITEPGNMAGCPPFMRGSEILPPYPSFMVGYPIMQNPWHGVCPVPDVAVQPSASTWQYGHNMMTPNAQARAYNSTHLTQPILWAQSTLSDWTQRYDELDQQLKALDRHRAMTNLTSDIASQRREIVQQRSDSKNMMNLISSWLSMSEQVHPGLDPHTLSPTFNVDAPAYVPMAQQTASSEPVTTSAQDSAEAHSRPDIQKPPPRAERRPIAIVPPPKLQTNISPSKEADEIPPESPENDDVDPWGVKIGPAPLDLQKQQSEMLESISEAQSQSSHSNRSQESLQSAPQGGFFQRTVNAVPQVDATSQTSDQDDHVEVPADIEAMYEEGLDALRKPKGNVTAIRMPDGSLVDVEGQDLQRPELSQMSDFEKSYWSRKPVLPQLSSSDVDVRAANWSRRITTTPVSQIVSPGKLDFSSPHNSGQSSGKENIAVSPTVHRKAATDTFLSRFNDSDPSDEVVSQAHGSQPVLSVRSSIVVKGQYLPKAAGSTHYKDVNPRRFAHDTHTNDSSNGPQATQLEDYSLAAASRNLSNDVFNNKGYSSTSVQNVHAVARWPQTLDGATDQTKGNKSKFSFASKIKSPGLLRRSTAHGGA